MRELYDLGWEEDGKTKKEEAVRVSGWLDARSGWTAGKLHGARVPCVQALSARELVWLLSVPPTRADKEHATAHCTWFPDPLPIACLLCMGPQLTPHSPSGDWQPLQLSKACAGSLPRALPRHTIPGPIHPRRSGWPPSQPSTLRASSRRPAPAACSQGPQAAAAPAAAAAIRGGQVALRAGQRPSWCTARSSCTSPASRASCPWSRCVARAAHEALHAHQCIGRQG